MKALVIYDSVFGNTEKIANAIGTAIGAALAPPDQVQTLQVGHVQPEQLAGLDLLVVGSPTRGFRPTEGLAEFLKRIPTRALQGVRVAAFDTRFSEADQESAGMRFLLKTGGYAAPRIADRLKKSGGVLVAPPEGFIVKDTEGPLKEGELERAAAWARQLLEAR
jgi:flavodoxin